MNRNRKIAVVILVVFIAILAILSVAIVIRLSQRNTTPDKSDAAVQSLTKIGGKIYCINKDATQFPLYEGKVIITSPSFGTKTAIVDYNGEWSENIDWSVVGNSYDIKFEFKDPSGSLINGVKYADLTSKDAVNCDYISALTSNPPTAIACNLSAGQKDVCSAEKTSYASCEINTPATDKVYGYKGFDFSFASCGEALSTDLEVKLTSKSVMVPGSKVSLNAVVTNKSLADLEFDKDGAGIVFSDLSKYFDSFTISCDPSTGLFSQCGVEDSFGNDSIGIRKLSAGKSIGISVEGKLKTGIKILDKVSISTNIALLSGLVDVNKTNNTALFEKIIVTDGLACSDSSLVWSQDICWNNVKRDADGVYKLYKSCEASECNPEVIRSLTEAEVCMLANWVKSGKQNVAACGSNNIVPVSSNASTNSSSNQSVTPVTVSSTSSSVASTDVVVETESSSSTSNSSVSTTTSKDGLPQTAIDLSPIGVLMAIGLIILGVISHRMYFSKLDYSVIYTKSKEINEIEKKTKEKSEVGFRKLRVESKLIISKILYKIKKRL